ncbi:Uncharacterised protein [Neisseria meningitidis]|nr:Uncharacterised protein [Neisseria meningitidis]CWT47983.1 Uncharacterised protein [Neisseria meningitidis]
MHHPVVGGSSQILADRHDGAVDDVAQIALAVVAVFADAVSLAVLDFLLVKLLVNCFKLIVIIGSTNRPRQQHFFPLIVLRLEAIFLNNAESVVVGISI